MFIKPLRHTRTIHPVPHMPTREQDLGAAAVFQSAATDTMGSTVRRRLSEVLLVDTSAAAVVGSSLMAGGGSLLGPLGGLLTGGGALGTNRTSLCGPGAPARRSLGGMEIMPLPTPSTAVSQIGIGISLGEEGRRMVRGGGR